MPLAIWPFGHHKEKLHLHAHDALLAENRLEEQRGCPYLFEAILRSFYQI